MPCRVGELEASLTQVLDAHAVTKDHVDIHVARVRSPPLCGVPRSEVGLGQAQRLSPQRVLHEQGWAQGVC